MFSHDCRTGRCSCLQVQILATERPNSPWCFGEIQIGECHAQRSTFLLAIHSHGNYRCSQAQEYRLPSFDPAEAPRSKRHRMVRVRRLDLKPVNCYLLNLWQDVDWGWCQSWTVHLLGWWWFGHWTDLAAEGMRCPWGRHSGFSVQEIHVSWRN